MSGDSGSDQPLANPWKLREGWNLSIKKTTGNGSRTRWANQGTLIHQINIAWADKQSLEMFTTERQVNDGLGHDLQMCHCEGLGLTQADARFDNSK